VRKKVMRRFKSAGQLWVHDQVANLFMHCRYNRDAQAKSQQRTQAFAAREGLRAPRGSAGSLYEINFAIPTEAIS
jgi:hypothetical protein